MWNFKVSIAPINFSMHSVVESKARSSHKVKCDQMYPAAPGGKISLAMSWTTHKAESNDINIKYCKHQWHFFLIDDTWLQIKNK